MLRVAAVSWSTKKFESRQSPQEFGVHKSWGIDDEHYKAVRKIPNPVHVSVS